MKTKNPICTFQISILLILLAISNTAQSQAINAADLPGDAHKTCDYITPGFYKCTVCDDKEMTKNCKKYYCTGEGTNCESVNKKNSSAQIARFENNGLQVNNKPNSTPSPQSNLGGATQIASSKMIKKKYGTTTLQIVSSSLFKDGLNVINFDSGVKFLVHYNKKKIIKLTFVKPDGKEFNNINLVPVAKYSCEGPICKCTGDDDCNEMFASGQCGYAECIDDSCYCLTVVN